MGGGGRCQGDSTQLLLQTGNACFLHFSMLFIKLKKVLGNISNDLPTVYNALWIVNSCFRNSFIYNQQLDFLKIIFYMNFYKLVDISFTCLKEAFHFIVFTLLNYRNFCSQFCHAVYCF